MTRFALAALIFLTVVANIPAQMKVGDAPATVLKTTPRETSEGWAWASKPVGDFVPWPLGGFQRAIRERDGQFIVVYGYLAVSAQSMVLYPSSAASWSGKLEGAIMLSQEDSPALKWLFPLRHTEGYYAIGGMLTCRPAGPLLGELSKVRFAMRKDELPVMPIVKFYQRPDLPNACPNGHKVRAVPRIVTGSSTPFYREGEAFSAGDVGHPWVPVLSYVCDKCRLVSDTGGKEWHPLEAGFGIDRDR